MENKIEKTEGVMTRRPCGNRAGLRVDECLNLMPESDAGADVLRPVGSPVVIGTGEWKPLVMDGDALLVTDGLKLGAMPVGGGAVTEIVSLPAEALCAECTATRVTVMTAAGPFVLLRQNGGYTPAGMMPAFPAVSFRTKSEGTLSVTVPSVKVEALGRECVEAYAKVAADAASAGLFIQPFLARCRFYDADGNMLFAGPVIAVTPAEGAQCATGITTGKGLADGMTAAFEFGVSAGRLQVRVHDRLEGAWRELVARMDVEVTPQFHPWDNTAGATVRTGRDASAPDYYSVTLPGAAWLPASNHKASARLMQSAFERFDELCEPVLTVTRPFDREGVYDVLIPQNRTLAESMRTLKAVLAKPVRRAPAELARLSVPNTFTADTAASTPGATLWGNVRAIPFGGYAPGWFAVTADDRRWRGGVTVTFRDGSRTVAMMDGTGAPADLWPLVSYPSPDAVHIAFGWICDDEEIYHGVSLDLTPTDDGRAAICVHPSIRAFAADDGVGEPDFGDIVAAPEKTDGLMAVTSSADNFNVRAVAALPARVQAIGRAYSAGGVWEWKRPRFNVFGADAIYLAIAEAGGDTLTLNALHGCGIVSRHAVADAGECLYALAGGSIVRLKGSRATVMADGVTAQMLGWDGTACALIAASADDNEAVHFLPDSGMASFCTSLVCRGGWLSHAGHVFAVTDAGLCDLSRRDDTAGPVSVRWHAQFAPGGRRRFLPRRLTWMLKTTDFRGTLTVSRSLLGYGAPAPATITRLKVSGYVRSPLTCPLAGHRAVDLDLMLEAEVAPDFRMTKPLID